MARTRTTTTLRPRIPNALQSRHSMTHLQQWVTRHIAPTGRLAGHPSRLLADGGALPYPDPARGAPGNGRVGAHGPGTESDAEWLDRLERRGVIRRGTAKPTREWLARKPSVGADV